MIAEWQIMFYEKLPIEYYPCLTAFFQFFATLRQTTFLLCWLAKDSTIG
jgi:hypothetical protein